MNISFQRIGKERVMPEPTTTCLDCGHQYTVLGSTSGVCPECGSRAVTPIGDVALDDVTTLNHYSGGDPLDGVHKVTVADDTERSIVYWVTEVNSVLRVTQIRLSGRDHEAANSWPGDPDSDWLPISLRAEIASEILGQERPESVTLMQ